jgi:hypothetical protein
MAWNRIALFEKDGAEIFRDCTKVYFTEGSKLDTASTALGKGSAAGRSLRRAGGP